MMRARRVRRRESSSHDDFFRSLSLMIFVCDDVFFYNDLFCCGSCIPDVCVVKASTMMCLEQQFDDKCVLMRCVDAPSSAPRV